MSTRYSLLIKIIMNLLDAIHCGDLDAVRILLDKKENQQTLLHNIEPLWIAGQSKNRDMIQLLIEKGANPHLENYHGQDFLCCITDSTRHSPSWITFCIQMGCKLNPISECHQLIWSTLIMEKKLHVTRLMMEKNPLIINSRLGWCGNTPISYAVLQSCPISFIDFLLYKGADPFMKNYNNESAMSIAMACPKDSIYRRFFENLEKACFLYYLGRNQLRFSQERFWVAEFLLRTKLKSIQKMEIVYKNLLNLSPYLIMELASFVG